MNSCKSNRFQGLFIIAALFSILLVRPETAHAQLDLVGISQALANFPKEFGAQMDGSVLTAVSHARLLMQDTQIKFGKNFEKLSVQIDDSAQLSLSRLRQIGNRFAEKRLRRFGCARRFRP